MTPPTETIHPITYDDYERIMQPTQQDQAGASPKQDTLQRETGIAAIGLMRDAMLTADEATTARWHDLQAEADGSGKLTIPARNRLRLETNDARTRRHGDLPPRIGNGTVTGRNHTPSRY